MRALCKVTLPRFRTTAPVNIKISSIRAANVINDQNKIQNAFRVTSVVGSWLETSSHKNAKTDAREVSHGAKRPGCDAPVKAVVNHGHEHGHGLRHGEHEFE